MSGQCATIGVLAPNSVVQTILGLARLEQLFSSVAPNEVDRSVGSISRAPQDLPLYLSRWDPRTRQAGVRFWQRESYKYQTLSATFANSYAI